MPILDGITVSDELLDAHDRVTSMSNDEFFDRCRQIGLPIAPYDTTSRWTLASWPRSEWPDGS